MSMEEKRGHCVIGTRISTFSVPDTKREQYQTRAHTAQALSWCNKVPLTHKLAASMAPHAGSEEP